MGEIHFDGTPASRFETKPKFRRNNHQIKQEWIANGLLVTLNKRDRVYFERVMPSRK